jgi:hypothetical protein
MRIHINCELEGCHGIIGEPNDLDPTFVNLPQHGMDNARVITILGDKFESMVDCVNP